MTKQDKNCINLQDFAFRLNHVMQSNRLKGSEIARALSVSDSAVSAWRRGLYMPTGRYWFVLARFLDVPPEWLYSGDIEALKEKKQSDWPNKKKIDELAVTYGEKNATREECEEYFRKFLETAGDHQSRLGWIMEELKSNFPLTKWAPPDE